MPNTSNKISVNPTWETLPSVEDMGGGAHKRNYLDQQPINPETDLDVTQYNTLCQTATHAIRTAEFATMTAVLGSTPSVTSYRGQHAVGPLQAPSITEQSTGVYRISWSPTYSDGFNQSAAITLVDCVVQVHGSTLLHAQPNKIDASTFDVYVFDAAGSAHGSNTLVTITVGASS